MLQELNIKGLAIIKDLKIDLSPHLNIFTGETGAGKTLIISSINLLQGEKVPSSLKGREIKIGANIIGFTREIREYLKEKGLESGKELIIRRVINKKGESKCYVNDFPVKLSVLKEVGKLLFEISSQTEHITLLNIANHRRIIDSFSGVEKDVSVFSKKFNEFKQVQKEIGDFEEKKEEIEEKIKELESELNEIISYNIKKDEEENLRKEYENLEELGKKKEIFSSTKFFFYEQDNSLYEALSKIEEEIESLKGKDVVDLKKRIKKVLLEIEDINERIGKIEESVEFSSDRMKEIQSRLDEIYSLKYKYGDNLVEAVKTREKRLKEIYSLKAKEEKLKIEYQELKDEIFKISKKLSEERKKNSKVFENKVNEELISIGMEDVKFKVKIEEKEISVDGKDKIEFYIKTNPGEEFKPLKEIASGGERSRFLLSIRNAMRRSLTKIIIFDEIDQGLSFSAGKKVGEKLKKVSLNNQIICITHLPAIAIYGERHFAVKKVKGINKTEVIVEELDREKKKEEIARMLLGRIDSKSLKQAERLLNSVRCKV